MTSLKSIFKYDDALDVFGVHGIKQVVGAVLTGIFVDPALGGTGDYTNYLAADASAVVGYNRHDQIIAQLWGVGTSVVWTTMVSLVALLIVKILVGLRVNEQAEREGLDILLAVASAPTTEPSSLQTADHLPRPVTASFAPDGKPSGAFLCPCPVADRLRNGVAGEMPAGLG